MTGSFLRPSLDSTSSQVTDDQSESERGDDMAGRRRRVSICLDSGVLRARDLVAW